MDLNGHPGGEEENGWNGGGDDEDANGLMKVDGDKVNAAGGTGHTKNKG